jgi:hypothetical protein
MRTFLLAIFAMGCLLSKAQTNLSIEINHKLNGNSFELMAEGTTNQGHPFMIDRLEYYLSGFFITSSSGESVVFDDAFLLADASETAFINLGTTNLEDIQTLSFSVGVGPDHNNGDPTLWPSDHPLAPQWPSMHWGWTAGYRFVAIEGTELNQNQTFELHGLGNQNYFRIDIDINQGLYEGDAVISLNANTEEILYDLNLDGGLIVHGDFGAAQSALSNMAARVFEYTGAALGVNENKTNIALEIYPNPVNNETFQVAWNSSNSDFFRLEIRDLQGKLILEESNVMSGDQVIAGKLESGFYLVQLYSEFSLLGVKKLVVQ